MGIILEISLSVLGDLLNFEACRGCVMRMPGMTEWEEAFCILSFMLPFGFYAANVCY